MKNTKTRVGTFLGGWKPAALLAVIMGLLFWRSFLPDYIHFSNDGPLGAQIFNAAQVPGAFTGAWNGLNAIGSGAVWGINSSTILNMIIGPLNYAKFLAPIALFILGLGAWLFFRGMKFTPVAALCGALALALGTGFFAGACWGVASGEIAIGFDFFALALMVANQTETKPVTRWLRIVLAGLCVGVNIMEAADVGALCSVFVAGFIFFRSLMETGQSVAARAARGVVQVAVVAIFAGIMGVNTIIALLGTPGISADTKMTETPQAHWDWATTWSLPKMETLGIIVPGLFGYRMDTPAGMDPMFKDKYNGGVYWGGMGRDPQVDRYLDSGGQNPPLDHIRFGYAGYYCGVLVVLVALWAIGQSTRRQHSVFDAREKYYVWYWAAMMVASLLLAWGRFAPAFYGTLYLIPHFSDIRNPTKFLFFFNWALAVLFAYGIHGLSRRHLEIQPEATGKVKAPAAKWDAFDSKWAAGSGVVLAGCVIGWMVYSSKKESLVTYLQKVGYGDASMANAIASFSINQAGWFLVLLGAAMALLTLISKGFFSGPRAKLGMGLLIAFLVVDFGRANLPFIIHWNYKDKYEVGSLNPVEEFLRDKPYEHRVAILPFEPQQQLPGYDYLFGGMGIYRIEWTQHHFLYYGIQSLDIIQMPRPPADWTAYEEALAPQGTMETAPLMTRRWELSNTRYLLGAAGFLDIMNQQLDPGKGRFRIALRFDLVPKPGVLQLSSLEDLTAVTNYDGQLALFEFTGALPRVKLYSNWVVNTNDTENLKNLGDLNFDPQKTVLISTPQQGLAAMATNDNSGTVEIKNYTSKHLAFTANATAPSVLLINDHYDPGWKVTVDGQPAPLLRCNYIMRGVYVPAGQHTVGLDYTLPNTPFFITAGAILAGILIGGVLLLMQLKKPAA